LQGRVNPSSILLFKDLKYPVRKINSSGIPRRSFRESRKELVEF